ncbi:MAG: nucleoid-associated protein [Sarcina sp.]
MEYVNDISIIDAVIHVLNKNNSEPILNNYKLDLTDEVYKFLYKHIEKCFKSEDLKYGAFLKEKRVVKDLAQDFLKGLKTDIIEVSQEFAKQLFYIMRANSSIPDCDLITVYMTTDQGTMIGIIKLDYVKSFTHSIEFLGEKLGIGIVEQQMGLPTTATKVQKCAFIRQIKEGQEVDLMFIDKQKRRADGEDFGAEYFTDHYLGCVVFQNERDSTKNFINAAERWTRNNITEDADKAFKVRDKIKSKLKKEEIINIDEIARETFKEEPEVQRSFSEYMELQGIERDVVIDKDFIERKLKRIRLNIDREIDIYLDDEVYNDSDKFEVVRNGDGTVNIVIKKIKNYIEK